MKNTEISQLLERYRSEGLSPDEKQRLETLAGKSEVFDKATHRAASLRRQRGLLVASATAVLIGAGLWIGLPSSPKPIYTDAQPSIQALPTDDVPIPDEQAPARTVEYAAAPMPTSAPVAASPSAPQPISQPTTSPKPARAEVFCNNQCEADSVISDIWKFLMA